MLATLYRLIRVLGVLSIRMQQARLQCTTRIASHRSSARPAPTTSSLHPQALHRLRIVFALSTSWLPRRTPRLCAVAAQRIPYITSSRSSAAAAPTACSLSTRPCAGAPPARKWPPREIAVSRFLSITTLGKSASRALRARKAGSRSWLAASVACAAMVCFQGQGSASFFVFIFLFFISISISIHNKIKKNK